MDKSKMKGKKGLGKTKKGSLAVVQKASLSGTQLPPSRVVTHREMVGSVTSAASASWQALGISALTPGYDFNPANALLFPWLSSQAGSWEKYRFTKLLFELIPGNPSTNPGRLYTVVDYDYDDEVPTSMEAMAGYYGLRSNDVWQPLRIIVDCNRMNQGIPYRFISQSDRINGVEPRTVFGGFLFCACQGTTTACTWDLFVEYTVDLQIPQSVAPGASATVVPRTVPLNAVPTGNYYPLNVNTAGSLATAVSGVPGVPSMQYAGISWAGLGVVDLTKYRRGKLEVDGVIASCVGTPAVNVVNTAFEAMCFDAAGSYLGVASPTCNLGVPFASQTTGGWGTNGISLATTWYLILPQLFAAFPALKYLALSLFNGTAKVGEVGNSFTGNLRASTLEL